MATPIIIAELELDQIKRTTCVNPNNLYIYIFILAKIYY